MPWGLEKLSKSIQQTGYGEGQAWGSVFQQAGGLDKYFRLFAENLEKQALKIKEKRLGLIIVHLGLLTLTFVLLPTRSLRLENKDPKSTLENFISPHQEA